MTYSVAVIIPCYNDSLTLDRAIQSVLKQTYPISEIVVVNDCSPFSPAIDDIVLQYPSINYIVNHVNLGLAASRNVGVKSSSSDVVSFLDADDEIHPQKIELQLGYLSPNSIVTSKLTRVPFTSNPTSELLPVITRCTYRQYSSRFLLYFSNSFVGASMLMHRSTFDDLGGFNSKLRSCEDLDFWFRSCYFGYNIRVIDSILYFYRLNDQSLSSSLVNISYWHTFVLRLHISAVKSDVLKPILFVILVLRVYYYFIRDNNIPLQRISRLLPSPYSYLIRVLHYLA